VASRGTTAPPVPGTLEVGPPDGRLGRWYAACRCERVGITVRLVASDRRAWLTLHPAARKP
jgi:hypothetical protein